MFSVNSRDTKKLERDLGKFAARAYPFATKSTLNSAAFMARGFAQDNIRSTMIERNRFTVQSVRVEQARTLDVDRQSATVGSIADYMETQEFGGLKTKTGAEGVPLATSYSSNEGRGARPRRKRPVRANQLQAIRLRKRGRKGRSRRQRNLVAVKDAAASGQKFVFLDLGRRKGIFRVVGGKRNPRVQMVFDLSRKSVVVPKNPWLLPAVTKTEGHMPRLYHDALTFQAKRAGLFK